MQEVLEVKNIEKYYGNKGNLTKAIDNISFNIAKGEFVGIMGASERMSALPITTRRYCTESICTLPRGRSTHWSGLPAVEKLHF